MSHSKRTLTLVAMLAATLAGRAIAQPPLPPPPPPPPAPVRVGGNIPPPTKIVDVRPAYPAIAQSARIQGVVILEVTIAPDGSIEDAKVLRSIPLLDAAAVDAVRQWKFTPTLLDGAAVPVVMTVTVNFSLGDTELPPHPCAEEGVKPADPPVVAPTTIRFVNRTAITRKVFRLNRDGNRDLMLTLDPNAELQQSVTAGEPWVVADQYGACAAIFVATTDRGLVTIR